MELCGSICIFLLLKYRINIYCGKVNSQLLYQAHDFKIDILFQIIEFIISDEHVCKIFNQYHIGIFSCFAEVNRAFYYVIFLQHFFYIFNELL